MSKGHTTAKRLRVRLIRKLASVIDGVDLEGRETGDILELAPEQARLLVAEGWALAIEAPATADDRSSIPPNLIIERRR